MADFSKLDDLKQRLLKPVSEESDLFGELCSYYLNCSEDERETIREAYYETRQAFYPAFMAKVTDELAETKELNKLRLGLVAACIENCKYDYRDTLVSLARLYVAAEQAGIEPMPHFQEIAKYASNKNTPGLGASMQKTLRDFNNQPVIAEERGSRYPLDPNMDALELLNAKLNAPLNQVKSLFENLAPYYLKAGNSQREAMRATFRKASFDLSQAALIYINKMSRQFKESKDPEYLRLALAAACIEDARLDYKETLRLLAELYLTAEELGLEPKNYFAELSELASEKSPQANAVEAFFSKFRFSLDRAVHYESRTIPMKEILVNFHASPELEARREQKKAR